MGPIKWHGFSLGENRFGTLPVQLQQWRPRDWQDYGCSQDKQKLPLHNPLDQTGDYLQLCSFTFLHYTIFT